MAVVVDVEAPLIGARKQITNVRAENDTVVAAHFCVRPLQLRFRPTFRYIRLHSLGPFGEVILRFHSLQLRKRGIVEFVGFPQQLELDFLDLTDRNAVKGHLQQLFSKHWTHCRRQPVRLTLDRCRDQIQPVSPRTNQRTPSKSENPWEIAVRLSRSLREAFGHRLLGFENLVV